MKIIEVLDREDLRIKDQIKAIKTEEMCFLDKALEEINPAFSQILKKGQLLIFNNQHIILILISIFFSLYKKGA